MIKELFENQQIFLNYFFENIDLKKAESIADSIIDCRGTIFFTGVGKSGIIAKKISQTFISTGTKAFYLASVDALHGDIGIINENDIVIIISKSGQSQELLDLVPYIKNKKAKIISFVSKENSILAKKSDDFIVLPVRKELCPFNLVPTISTEVQLIFGDVIATYVMRRKEFTIEDFAWNHPAGAIGKRISLKVEDIMIKDKNIPICLEDDFLIDFLSVLSSKKCGALLVTDSNQMLKGIFTDGDLRRSIEKFGSAFLNKPIKELMTIAPKFTRKKILAIDAMKQMEDDKLITVLPVLDKEKVIGIIRMHDIIQAGLNYK